LDAAAAAAVAHWPRMLLACHPRQRRMAPFSANAVMAVQHRSTHHDAAAHAGAQDGAEQHAASRAGAIDRLGQREAVGIVREAHFPLETLLDIAPAARAV